MDPVWIPTKFSTGDGHTIHHHHVEYDFVFSPSLVLLAFWPVSYFVFIRLLAVLIMPVSSSPSYGNRCEVGYRSFVGTYVVLLEVVLVILCHVHRFSCQGVILFFCWLIVSLTCCWFGCTRTLRSLMISRYSLTLLV